MPVDQSYADRMAQQRRERWPFPESSKPLLAAWHNVAERVARVHRGRPNVIARDDMSGRGEPLGPRDWSDDFGKGYKIFLVYFLPAEGKDAPANHNLAVIFSVGGGVKITAGGPGTQLSITRHQPTPERFETDLVMAASMVGLLPEAPEDAGEGDF